MERDIGELKGYIAMLLSDLIKEREERNIRPIAVGMSMIQSTLVNDAKIALNALCSDKVLTYSRTLNDIAFEFTPPK